MTTTTTPAWNGYPLNPTVDGWHWRESLKFGCPVPRKWHADMGRWETTDGGLRAPHEVAPIWRYLGPCLTSTDLAAYTAAAWQAGRDAAAATAGGWDCPRCHTPGSIESAIAALPVPDADALADAIQRAVAVEREECAKVAERFSRLSDEQAKHYGDGPRLIAAAIRARGQA